MITLDTNLGISSSFNSLLLKLRKKYGSSNTTIDKNTEASAAKGSSQTNKTETTEKTGGVSKLALKENLDYEQIIKDLKLNLPENKFAILMMMPISQLYELLELLDKDDLLNGLKFYTKEKLMKFIGKLPKSDLLQMLFQLYTDKSQLIENLPTKELYRFLGSQKIDNRHFMKIFELMSKENLAQIVGHLTGEKCENLNQRDLLGKLQPFKKFQLISGIKQFDEKTLRGFITNMAETFPNLYNEFSHVALYENSSKFARTDLIKSMQVIDNSKIIGMISQLPDKLLALTVSQIDTEDFASILLNKNQDLLASLVLG